MMLVTSIPNWVVIIVVQLCLVGCSADYFWDGDEWKWQDSPADTRDQYEGSGVDGYDHPLYRPEDEEDDSSGEDTSDWDGEEDLGDSDIVNIDDEIDPRDLDIGFHEEVTIHYQDWWTSSSSSTPATISAKTSVPAMNPNNPSVSDESEEEDPHKHATASQDTNFFSQPGILTGGSVVGLLATILLIMFIIYRMRKADEGSYSLNEPKRSPNVHSYLKAPSREFFA